jgi:hypothetical protein
MLKKLLSAVAAGGTLVGLFAVPATADPVNSKNAVVLPMACDNGQSYQVVIEGNAAFVPAHVIGSNLMFVPVAFGPITSTAVPSGIPLFTAPPRTKGESASSPNAQTTCTFDVIFLISRDEAQRFGLPLGKTGIENVGTVTGFFSSPATDRCVTRPAARPEAPDGHSAPYDVDLARACVV